MRNSHGKRDIGVRAVNCLLVFCVNSEKAEMRPRPKWKPKNYQFQRLDNGRSSIRSCMLPELFSGVPKRRTALGCAVWSEFPKFAGF